MNKTLLRGASMILAIILAIGFFIPGQATTQNAALMPNETVSLAFFYKPPSNSTAAIVAGNFNNVVLTGGDESFRDQLASNGFGSTIPQYFRGEAIQNPGNCTSSPAKNQIANRAGDFCSISQNHPDWFLLDTNGNRMKTSPTSSYYRMDIGNAGWRQFFVTRLLQIQKEKGWSGLFLDNVEASLSEIQRDGLTPAKYRDHASYQAAVLGFLQYLDVNYSQPYNRPIVANIIARSNDAAWYDYMQYLDGAMQERWAVKWSATEYLSESKWKSDMALAEKTQSLGKYIMLVAPGSKADASRQKFAFASYLLVSNGKASFRYADEDVYGEIWLYDNYNVDLGSPKGPRYQVGTSTSWRRDFAKGYVVVDPVSHTAKISTAAAATNTPVPATSVIYNDQNAGFVYSAGWANVTDSLAYKDQFNRTLIVGSSVSFNFTGPKFSIIYKTGPIFGNMAVYVDGKLLHTINQQTSTATYQKKWSYGGALSTGSHKLKLVFTSGPADGRISLDAVSIP